MGLGFGHSEMYIICNLQVGFQYMLGHKIEGKGLWHTATYYNSPEHQQSQRHMHNLKNTKFKFTSIGTKIVVLLINEASNEIK